MKGTRHNAKKKTFSLFSLPWPRIKFDVESFREKFTLNSEIGETVNKIPRCQAESALRVVNKK